MPLSAHRAVAERIGIIGFTPNQITKREYVFPHLRQDICYSHDPVVSNTDAASSNDMYVLLNNGFAPPGFALEDSSRERPDLLPNDEA